MKKKRNGWICFIIAAVCFALALGICGFNMIENFRAANQSRHMAELLRISPTDLAEGEFPDYILNPQMEMPVKSVDGIGYIGLLSVPSQQLELPVIGEWNYPNLKKSPCRYVGSAYTNDLVIAAHNFSSHFGEIKNLNIGDRVRFTDVDGNVFDYRVVETETLQPTAVEEMKSGDWDLTLFTCTLGGSYRVTVRCELEQ